MNNPMNMLKGFVNNINPQQVVLNMLGNTNNPIFSNLAQMAQKGDKKGIEEFARNIYKEKGLNFDEEYSKFMKNFNGYQHNSR